MKLSRILPLALVALMASACASLGDSSQPSTSSSTSRPTSSSPTDYPYRVMAKNELKLYSLKDKGSTRLPQNVGPKTVADALKAAHSWAKQIGLVRPGFDTPQYAILQDGQVFDCGWMYNIGDGQDEDVISWCEKAKLFLIPTRVVNYYAKYGASSGPLIIPDVVREYALLVTRPSNNDPRMIKLCLAGALMAAGVRNGYFPNDVAYQHMQGAAESGYALKRGFEKGRGAC